MSGMLRALYPGSFDPPSNGHMNIIHRISGIYDEIDVVVATNPEKQYTFDATERLDLMRTVCEPYENVQVYQWDRLIVEFAEKVGARVMIRGVRALSDFEYEFELSMINKGLNPRIETIFMPTDPKYFVLRSSAIKELARLDGDISRMVPAVVAERLKEKIRAGSRSRRRLGEG